MVLLTLSLQGEAAVKCSAVHWWAAGRVQARVRQESGRRQAGGRQEPGRSQAGVQAGGRHEPCSGLVEPGQEVQVGAVGGPQKGCVHW